MFWASYWAGKRTGVYKYVGKDEDYFYFREIKTGWMTAKKNYELNTNLFMLLAYDGGEG